MIKIHLGHLLSDNWEFYMINYAHVRKIHQSSNGTIVLEVRDKENGKLYALKLIGPLSFPLNKLVFEREINALKALNAYDEIVHTYDVARNVKFNGKNDYGGILLELIEGTSLENFNYRSMSDTQKYHSCIQIAQGILHAHNNGIIHRDVKPGNIMISSSGKIKIIDFGSSKIKSLVERETVRNFYSPLYSAPEILTGGVANELSDIYSLGAVFFWIFCGKDPANTVPDFINLINESNLRGNFKTLLLRMVDPDPQKRIDDINTIISEIKKNIASLSSTTDKYVFSIESKQLDILKNDNIISQATTMQQFLLAYLPNEFSEIYGNFDGSSTFQFVGDRTYMECIYITETNRFVSTKIRNITPSRSLKLKKIYKQIDGIIRFNGMITKEQSNNLQLCNILVNYCEDSNESQRKSQVFNDLFGKWEDSIQESINSIKQKSAAIHFSDFEIDKGTLTLCVSEYVNCEVDNIAPETKYIIEEMMGKRCITHHLGIFERVFYEGDDVKFAIALNKRLNITHLRMLLSQQHILLEDYTIKINAYTRQLVALRSLRNDEYSAHGLKDILLDIAIPGTVSQIRSPRIDNMLNEFQKLAVKKALNSESISLIQGPPGTGKTKVIGEILKQIFFSDSAKAVKPKVLIVSQSNTAVDNVLEGVQEWINSTSIRVLRIGDKKKVTETIQKDYIVDAIREKVFHNAKYNSVEYVKAKLDFFKAIADTEQGIHGVQLWEKVSEIQNDWLKRCSNFEVIDRYLIASAAIIAGTCVGFLSNEHVRDFTFDYVIIDEAAKATTPELLVSIIKAEKIILVGDQNQLPPYADQETSHLASELVKDPNYRLFDLLYENLPETHKQRLLTQYRMIQNIGDLVSTVFYDGQINTGIDDSLRQHNIPFLHGISIVWYNTAGISNHCERRLPGDSFINVEENNVIKSLLEKLDRLEDSPFFDIGIITGYAAQRDYIRNSITNRGFDNLHLPMIDTLDAFQGRENDIIIYSTVRTEKTIGFQKEKERINVAFSRAKKLLIIVGDLNFFYSWNGDQNKFIEIIGYIERHPDTCRIINITNGENV
jgi:serine/threonine protein kinase